MSTEIPMRMQHDARSISQHTYPEMHNIPVSFPPGMIPQYPMPPQHVHHHMRHASEHYEGSPAPEDSNNEGGGKRKRGNTSSMANDQELRRLLSQYQGRTLNDVAAEVQKNEGSGGKSEKAKQVFAMLWLQETCKRSTHSVRRDKVFARYTERCGNERVPTLNPASFGKLVRIIFPNVQTRRLGVRGESKYHYVDLSLVPDDNDSPFDDRPATAQGIDRPQSSASLRPNMEEGTSGLDTLPPRMAMETADFPAPTAVHVPRMAPVQPKRSIDRTITKLDCQYANTPVIRIDKYQMSNALVNALPSIRTNMPATLSTYMAMPSERTLSQPTPSLQESPIDLPDIHEYLVGTNYDHHLAKLLHDLYKSYCIDVIDAFRKCKDKSFFNHHSAFNGKMTVPVSKIFNMECIAPWIQECDMRMYKSILRYMTQLVVQAVPDAVWNAFDRIGSRLVSHIAFSFEEKCPQHVVVAKVVPAARFVALLKKLQLAQAATVSASRILEQPSMGTQMWLDLLAMGEASALIQDSTPPPESIQIIQGILKHDIRVLLSPLPDALVPAAEQDPTSAYAAFYQDPLQYPSLLSSAGMMPHDMISRLVLWLENLAVAFEGHHPQCMIDWTTRLFRIIMTQICQGGGTSYQAWWCMDNFANQMLSFMTQLEGFLLPAEEQVKHDAKEVEKNAQYTATLPPPQLKRKRTSLNVGGDTRSRPSPALPQDNGNESFSEVARNLNLNLAPPQRLQPTNTIHDHELDIDTEMAEINGPTLDLPTFRTGFTSPMKPMHLHDLRGPTPAKPGHQHDDSGIEMSLLEDGKEGDTSKSGKKHFSSRDWFLSSDPVQPVGQGVGA
ncbi:hypothetical protein BT93_L4185 [Corymbia citriodora subsp. variegata]|uniref:RFX-type winged-helix domain-containing protein n=1 Tax=Corymbia citriodora subsp. variegata TaxID=360336 RepID=A0A8T0CG59_CORYI|nr:hypothetical protein BT93_L4185 [Corymbia citriodora subsp. variegata]